MVSDHILYYEFTQNEKGENVLIFKRCADGEENGKWIGWYTKGYDNPEDEIDYPHTRMVFKYTKFEIIEQREHEWDGKKYLFVKYRLTNEQNNLSFEFDHDFIKI